MVHQKYQNTSKICCKKYNYCDFIFFQFMLYILMPHYNWWQNLFNAFFISFSLHYQSNMNMKFGCIWLNRFIIIKFQTFLINYGHPVRNKYMKTILTRKLCLIGHLNLLFYKIIMTNVNLHMCFTFLSHIFNFYNLQFF